ncbi:MAG TPA: hypothetical protein VLB67_15375 [Acidimicrobiia bacterium]|nr:hypothetical protein [Acidimicrobiia bacterium]
MGVVVNAIVTPTPVPSRWLIRSSRNGRHDGCIESVGEFDIETSADLGL